MNEANTTELILYTTPDGEIKIDTILRNKTIWLTREKMAGLFGVRWPAIMYLDYAELQAKQRKPVTMAHWSDKLDAFLTFNEQKLLTHAGKVKAGVAKTLAEKQYEVFDANRKKTEALAADEELIKVTICL